MTLFRNYSFIPSPHCPYLWQNDLFNVKFNEPTDVLTVLRDQNPIAEHRKSNLNITLGKHCVGHQSEKSFYFHRTKQNKFIEIPRKRRDFNSNNIVTVICVETQKGELPLMLSINCIQYVYEDIDVNLILQALFFDYRYNFHFTSRPLIAKLPNPFGNTIVVVITKRTIIDTTTYIRAI